MNSNQVQSKAMMPRRICRAAVAAMVVVLAACGSDSVTNPLLEPEVANLADNFQFQATAASHVTQTISYDWQNSGTAANVDQSGAINGGTATLRIRDANGTEVYTGDLTTTGSFTSNAGTPGTWKIQLVLVDVSGNLNFRVQKP